MAIYRIAGDHVRPLDKTTFQAEGMLERQDLQRLFRHNIEPLVPDAMVLAEEFGDWQDSRRRIDLLCLDRDAGLVVVELKRTEDGGHMELQAIRYAAMVSHMTFDAAVRAHHRFLGDNQISENAEERILEYLGWDEPQEDAFAFEVSIVLASGEFSREIMTAVMWLGEHDIDIRCIKLMPYKLGQERLLDIVQIYPLPEAADYQVRLKEKEHKERRMRVQNRDLTRFHLTIGEHVHSNLPKRRLALLVIREAVRRGAKPLDVYPGRNWMIVSGDHNGESFLRVTPEEGNSLFRSGRFFAKDDELMKADGKTYALTRMWGSQTLGEVDRIIARFGMDDVAYEPMK